MCLLQCQCQNEEIINGTEFFSFYLILSAEIPLMNEKKCVLCVITVIDWLSFHLFVMS